MWLWNIVMTFYFAQEGILYFRYINTWVTQHCTWKLKDVGYDKTKHCCLWNIQDEIELRVIIKKKLKWQTLWVNCYSLWPHLKESLKALETKWWWSVVRQHYGQPALKVYCFSSLNVCMRGASPCINIPVKWAFTHKHHWIFSSLLSHMLAHHTLCHPLWIKETEIIPGSHFFTTWSDRDHNKIIHPSWLDLSFTIGQVALHHGQAWLSTLPTPPRACAHISLSR